MKYLFLSCSLILPLILPAQQISYSNQAIGGIDFQKILPLNNNELVLCYRSSFDSFTYNNQSIYNSVPQYSSQNTYLVTLNEQEILSYQEWRGEGGKSFRAYDLARDSGGNYYMSFLCAGNTIYLNNTPLYNDPDSLTKFGILKLSPTGQPLYCRRFPNSFVGDAKIAFLPNGKLVVSGYTSYTDIQLDSFLLPCTGCGIHDSDVFIAVLDSQGQVLNARRFGSISWDYCNDLLITEDGSIYITGSYYYDFSVNDTVFTHSGFAGLTSDAYLLKLSSSLEVQWALLTQSMGSEFGMTLAKDADGHFLWGIEYKSSDVWVGDTILIGNTQNSMVCRVTPGGSLEWAQNIIGNGNGSRIRSMMIDEDNSVWLAVSFAGEITVDNLSISTLQSATSWESALIRFDVLTGAMMEHYVLTGNKSESILQLSPLGNHRLLFAGSYNSDYCSMLNMTLTDDQEYGSPLYWAILDYPPVLTSEPSRPGAQPLAVQPNPLPHDQPLTLSLPEGEGGVIAIYRASGALYGRVAALGSQVVLPGGYFQPGMYFAVGHTENGATASTKIIVY